MFDTFLKFYSVKYWPSYFPGMTDRAKEIVKDLDTANRPIEANRRGQIFLPKRIRISFLGFGKSVLPYRTRMSPFGLAKIFVP